MPGHRARGLLWLALAATLAFPGIAAAQYGGSGASPEAAAPAKQEKREKQEPRRRWGRGRDGDEKTWGHSYTIDERTGRRLLEAREHLLAERYDEAEEALGKLRMRSLNPLEKAQVHRIRAFIRYGQSDFAGAREYLEKTAAEGVLSPEDQADIRFQIAQIYLQEERWRDAADQLEKWFTMVESPNSAAYYLLALTYWQLEDMEAALPPAKQAVELSDAPKEGWLQLLLALRLNRKEYQESVPLLEELIRRFPKKVYWLQLSTLHGALGSYERALVPLQLAYTQGLLTEDGELRRLAQLLLFLDLPYRAARVVELGLEEEQLEADAGAFELLSNSWIAAREYDRAVEPLERAAELSEGGGLYVRLAQVHIQREKWSDAAAALRLALEKGGLESTGDAQLLMGIAYFSQKRPQQAQTWFSRARRHAETRDEADTWLKYIERELRSRAG